MSKSAMPKKIMVFGDDARSKLIEGAELMYRAVCATLSPKGNNVAIARQWAIPIVMHDGVTVANAVDSEDPCIKMGMDLVRQAARKTVDECGDGTTTSTLLAYEILSRGVKLIQEKKMKPMVLRKQLYDVLTILKEELPADSIPVREQKDVERVATISANDPRMGSLVAQAYEKVGRDGLVTAEESRTTETFVTFTEGMTFDKGWAAPHFVTNENRMEAVLENPLIAVIDKKISLNAEIVPLLNVMVKLSKTFVIVGEITGDALSTIVLNKMKGNFNALVVNPPGYGDRRTSALQDISLITGATLFAKELGMVPEEFAASFKTSWLGKAKRVISDKKSTIIIEGAGKKEIVQAEVERLRGLIQTESNPFEVEKYQERLAKMTNGVAVLKVGGKTEIESRERLERAKDAVGAARAAIDGGIVAGGGKAFLNLRKRLARRGKNTPGKQLMLTVLEQVSRKVMENSGEDQETIDTNIATMLAARSKWTGYEAENGRMVNLLNEGVIDPAKVIRVSLENSISVASSILTTEVLINTIEVEVFND